MIFERKFRLVIRLKIILLKYVYFILWLFCLYISLGTVCTPLVTVEAKRVSSFSDPLELGLYIDKAVCQDHIYVLEIKPGSSGRAA